MSIDAQGQQQTNVSPDGQWVWDGSSWVPTAGQFSTPPKKKSRRGLKIAGAVAGGFAALVIAGAALGGGTSTTPPPQDTASSAGVNAGESDTADVEDVPAEVVAAPEAAPAEAPEADDAAAEHDSLDNLSAVEQAASDLNDLNEDVSDMQHDLATASSSWALMNAGGIAFNVAQLQAFEAPDSISEEWNSSMSDLTDAHEDLMTGLENDSVRQMKSALADIEKATDDLQDVLKSW